MEPRGKDRERENERERERQRKRGGRGSRVVERIRGLAGSLSEEIRGFIELSRGITIN